jgi:hypothetical protein
MNYEPEPLRQNLISACASSFECTVTLDGSLTQSLSRQCWAGGSRCVTVFDESGLFKACDALTFRSEISRCFFNEV